MVVPQPRRTLMDLLQVQEKLEQKSLIARNRMDERMADALIIWKHQLSETEKARLSLAMFPKHIFDELPLSILDDTEQKKVLSHLMEFAGDLS